MQGRDPNYVRVMSCPRCGLLLPFLLVWVRVRGWRDHTLPLRAH